LEETKDHVIELEGDADADIKMLTNSSFAELGVCPEICKACEGMGYKHPSRI
jgi:hypothetical protein